MYPSPLEQRGNVKTAGTSECGGNSGLEVYQRRAVDYERRAGEMLHSTNRAKGAAKKGWKTVSHDATALRELGVSRTQSSRWQSIAALPETEIMSLPPVP